MLTFPLSPLGFSLALLFPHSLSPFHANPLDKFVTTNYAKDVPFDKKGALLFRGKRITEERALHRRNGVRETVRREENASEASFPSLLGVSLSHSRTAPNIIKHRTNNQEQKTEILP